MPGVRVRGPAKFANANVLAIVKLPAGTPAVSTIRYSLEVLAPEGLTPSRRQLGLGQHRLGRDPGCEVVLEARGVSREHVQVEVLAQGCVLRDLGSTNGSRVDGLPLVERALSGDCVLELGPVRLRLREHSAEAGSLAFHLPPEAPPERGAAADPAPTPPTRAANLQAQLRDALWDALPEARARFPEAARRMLDAMLPALAVEGLQLRHRDALVIAQAGACGAAEPWLRCGDLSLWAPAVAPPANSVAQTLLSSLLAFCPDPAPAAMAAGTAIGATLPGVPSRHPALIRLGTALQRIAKSRVGVLLLGETGSGKEVFARFVHACSPRAEGPFVAVNCAALPRDLLEAELFGIEKGAATGVEARAGVFERAHGGSLFLDELGDMPADTQVRLLRALEDGRIHRVGGKRLIEVDVRLVGATHRDLQAEVQAGRFRLDLYHRLAGFEAQLPPLRARRADIAALAAHFFERALAASQQHSPGISAAAMAALEAWHWPGNVRELRQVIDSACALLLPGEALDLLHLPPRLQQASGGARATPVRAGAADAPDLESVLLAAEREALLAALEACSGSHEAAWTRLGIGKTSFYKKLKQHGLGRGED